MSSSPSRRELLAWALLVLVGVTAILQTRAAPVDAGSGGPTTEVVYLATGLNYPDALGAAATAALGLGPVLLVQQNAIPPATLAELNRLQPERVIIVGGTSVISAGVEGQVQALAYTQQVVRYAGTNRYETAAALSQAVFPTTGLYPRVATASRSAITIPNSGFSGLIQSFMTATITAPARGMLVISASADTWGLSTFPNIFRCEISVGDTALAHSRRDMTFESAGTDEQNCATDAFMAVNPGTHTVRFRANLADDGFMGDGAMTVIWLPFDGVGQVP
jgi:hypothetical protein